MSVELNRKKIFIQNKIKTPKFLSIKRANYKKNKIIKTIIKSKINFPIVLKPVNEGSSLGVVICKNKVDLTSLSDQLQTCLEKSNVGLETDQVLSRFYIGKS